MFMYPSIYLASQSPRRAELLTQIGVPFELLLANPNEDVESLENHIAQESPAHYVSRVTQLKGTAAVIRLSQRAMPIKPILAADTTVAIGGTMLGKPRDADDAARMLKLLSGRSHRVFTAVSLAYNGKMLSALSTSKIRFTRLSAAQIDRYIETKEPFGKAGAYAIQGFAATFIQKIEGSHSGIMGLPLFETNQLLAAYLQSNEARTLVKPIDTN